MEILDSPQSDIEFVNEETNYILQKSCVWKKIFAISSLVIIGIFILWMMFLISVYSVFVLEIIIDLNLLLVFIILFIATYCFVCVLLIKSANKQNQYLYTGNQDKLISSYLLLAKSWRTLGVITIIGLLVLLIAVIISF
jgi:sensor histidine kinase YesM